MTMCSINEKIEMFKECYIREYGHRKYREIFSKISSSKKVANLIEQSKIKQISPNKNDYIFLLNEMPYFLFSRTDTLAMGAVFALELWHKTLNEDYYYLDEYNLDSVFKGIIYNSNLMRY